MKNIIVSLLFCLIFSVISLLVAVSSARADWSQDAGNAQRTGYTTEEPTEPWTFQWTWNGPDNNGGTGQHLYDAPKEARTIVGGGRIYVPAGNKGMYALQLNTGSQVWNFAQTSFTATPAYDATSRMVYAGGTNGTVYKINAENGALLGTYSAGSGINKAVLLVGNYVYIVTESGQLHKIQTSSMTPVWVYSANARADTPPTYSANKDLLVFATADLYVHAVVNATGTQKWRTKPSPNTAGFPNTFDKGWPVIAEQHGIVFVRMQLQHDAMNAYPGTKNIFPNDLLTTRQWLINNPKYKNLFALDLDTGNEKFTPAVGYGSTEDYMNGAAYGVMGSQPVVKLLPDGKEVAYIHFRNGQSDPPDYRWDGHMGEMVLDSTTVPGLVAGDLRFIRMSRYNGYGGVGNVHIIDEQEPIVVAGNSIFHAHWAASEGVRIIDRSNAKGLSYNNPIEVTNYPVVMRAMKACGTKNTATHYTTCGMNYVTDGGRFYNPPGYWVYWDVADPPGWRVGSGNSAGTSYSAGFLPRYTYVSNGYVIVEGNGGDLFVMKYNDSSTPAPTISLAPTGTNSQNMALTLFLHGIGKSGDNSNPTAVGNMNPLHPQRTATVEFYNSSNILTGTKFSTLNFLPAGEAGQLATGSFTGSVDVSSLPSGVYTAKIKVAQYLKKGIPGIITLPAIASATVGPISFTTGDANNDNTLSILDYNLLLDCFSDLTPAKNCSDPSKKGATDLTDDGNVNQFDYNLFLRELSVQTGE